MHRLLKLMNSPLMENHYDSKAMCTRGSSAPAELSKKFKFKFLACLYFQLKEVPSDTFVQILENDNFLLGCLRDFFSQHPKPGEPAEREPDREVQAISGVPDQTIRVGVRHRAGRRGARCCRAERVAFDLKTRLFRS